MAFSNFGFLKLIDGQWLRVEEINNYYMNVVYSNLIMCACYGDYMILLNRNSLKVHQLSTVREWSHAIEFHPEINQTSATICNGALYLVGMQSSDNNWTKEVKTFTGCDHI